MLKLEHEKELKQIIFILIIVSLAVPKRVWLKEVKTKLLNQNYQRNKNSTAVQFHKWVCFLMLQC